MERNLQKKYDDLLKELKALESVAVAFSGGVDSTFLLKAAQEALDGRVIAVTIKSKSFPERERKEAAAFCSDNGIRQVVCETNELDIEGFRENPKNRCYLCKRELFRRIQNIADEYGMNAVVEGSNQDDLGAYRPGLRAIRELGIVSPLQRSELGKADIRALSKNMGLPTWDKPSFACLASRFPYGDAITEEKLSMIDRAEQLLFDLGFRQVRVRIHGRIARVEVLPGEFERMLDPKVREMVYARFREFGFTYVTLDLRGYRTGSMDETWMKPDSVLNSYLDFIIGKC